MGTLGINPHGPVTEDIEFNWHKRASPYILARLKAEAEFLKCCRERGLPGVALCVANTYGPEDYQPTRSEEHTSELQSLMRISYAVFCLKKKNTTTQNTART